MQINKDVLKLIAKYDGQYAGHLSGDPERTYDKILKLCNHNLQLAADHFEYADNIHNDMYGGDDE